MLVCRKINLNTDLTPFMKINSKWIIELYLKYKTTKFLEQNVGEDLRVLGFGDEFLDTTPKA